MVRFRRVGVGGYKSIANLQSLPLQPVTVLVGANGAGKSNLLSFLRLLASIPARRLGEFVGLAGGADTLLWYGGKQTPWLWAYLEFEGKTGEGRYYFRLSRTESDSLIFSEEQINYAITRAAGPRNYVLGSGHRESLLMEGENRFQELWDLLAGIQIFHFEDTSANAAVRSRVYIEDGHALRRDAGNLSAFLYGLRHRERAYYDRIVSTIRLIAPFFDDFVLAPSPVEPNSILLNWKDRDSEYMFGPHQLSDGTLRAMALVALLRQPENQLPALIVLDEPEIGLHPYALEILAALVKGAAQHCQVILATQSVALVNHFEPEEVITVSRADGTSRFERHSKESLASWLEDYSMGDIWEKNLIGGTPSR